MEWFRFEKEEEVKTKKPTKIAIYFTYLFYILWHIPIFIIIFLGLLIILL